MLTASITKSFTAMAVMQLVEAGKVDLDAPIQRYLPWSRVGLPTLPANAGMVGGDMDERAIERAVRSLASTALSQPVGSTRPCPCAAAYDVYDRRISSGSSTCCCKYWSFSRVVDHLDAELQGPLRLFSPLLRRQFAQEGSRHLDEAVRRLETGSATSKAP